MTDYLRTPKRKTEAELVAEALAASRRLATKRRREARARADRELAAKRAAAYAAGDEHLYHSLLDRNLRHRGVELPFAVRARATAPEPPHPTRQKHAERTYRGIDWTENGWRARVYLRRNERVFLGRFPRVQDAEAAMRAAHARLGLPPPEYVDPAPRDARGRRTHPNGVRTVHPAEQLALDFGPDPSQRVTDDANQAPTTQNESLARDDRGGGGPGRRDGVRPGS